MGVPTRRAAAMLAAALVLVAAATALVATRLLGGSEQEAPAPVRRALEAVGAAGEPGLVTTLLTTGGTVRLWAAADEGAVRCYLVELVRNAEGHGVCAPGATGTAPLFLSRSSSDVRPRGVELLHGRVGDGVNGVELRFADGTRLELGETEGFVLHEVTAAEPAAAIALGDLERELGVVGLRGTPFAPRGRSQAVTTSGTGGLARLTLVPGARGTQCRQLRLRGDSLVHCDSPLARGASALRAYLGSLASGAAFLHGAVAPDVTSLRLRFADGSTARIPFTGRAYLYELPAGRAPRELAALGSGGRVVARTPIS